MGEKVIQYLEKVKGLKYAIAQLDIAGVQRLELKRAEAHREALIELGCKFPEKDICCDPPTCEVCQRLLLAQMAFEMEE